MKIRTGFGVGIIVAGLVSAAFAIRGTALEASGEETNMSSVKVSAKLPVIDENQPARFETATFALG